MSAAARRTAIACWSALLACAACAILTAAVLAASGASRWDAIRATAPGRALALVPGTHTLHTDSWFPMLRALEARAADPARRLYGAALRDTLKFQYPPTSLLPFVVLPPPWRATDPARAEPRPALRAVLDALTRAGGWATILLAPVLALATLRRVTGDRPDRATTAWIALPAAGLALVHFPLLRGVELGQVQVPIDLLATGALLAVVRERPTVAGVLVGACVLLKPQFGVLLVWGALRRWWPFVRAMGATLLAGGAASLAVFGLADHLDYLRVLSRITRRGEVYWANQSVNGVLHRLLGHGEPTVFTPTAYAPYSPVVHAATVVSGLAVILLAWRRPAGAARAGAATRAVDAAGVMLAATLGAPVAWEHHYGVALPAGIVLLVSLAAVGAPARLLGAAITGHVLVAVTVLRPEALLGLLPGGLALAHTFVGGVLLLVVALRARGAAAPAAAPPGYAAA